MMQGAAEAGKLPHKGGKPVPKGDSGTGTSRMRARPRGVQMTRAELVLPRVTHSPGIARAARSNEEGLTSSKVGKAG